MSIFSAIGGALKGAVGGFLGGGLPGAVIGTVTGAAGGFGGGGGGRNLPSLPGAGRGGIPRLPPINIRGGRLGGIAGGAAAGAAAGYGARYLTEGGARRRSTRGFSARDVRQAKRLMKMLKEVSAAAPKPRTIRTTARHCD